MHRPYIHGYGLLYLHFLDDRLIEHSDGWACMCVCIHIYRMRTDSILLDAMKKTGGDNSLERIEELIEEIDHDV
jgi:hypothetical protein